MDKAAVARVVADCGALGPARDDRVGDRVALAGAQRLRWDAGWLRDHDDVIALEQDLDRHVGVGYRTQRIAADGLALELDDVAGDDPVALLRALAAQAYSTGIEQLGELAAA